MTRDRRALIPFAGFQWMASMMPQPAEGVIDQEAGGCEWLGSLPDGLSVFGLI